MTDKLRVAQIVLDIIAVALLISAIGYVWYEKNVVKVLIFDPCRVCEEKTGGLCVTNIPVISSSAAHQPINISNIKRYVVNAS